MNDERIKEIVNDHYFGEGPTQLIEASFHKAIKLALAERDREIADWLEKESYNFDYGEVLRMLANELRQRAGDEKQRR